MTAISRWPRLQQVVQYHVRRRRVVERDVGDSLQFAVPGNGNRWQRRDCRQGRVDGDESFRAAALQDVGILQQHVFIVVMHDGDEEILPFAEHLFNAADYNAAVGIADFGAQHSDRVGPLLAQRPGEEIGVVIQFLAPRQKCGLWCAVEWPARTGNYSELPRRFPWSIPGVWQGP